MGGAEVFVFPGGGITVMVDVLNLPDRAFGYVPTPALVAPIEFTLPLDLYAECGGHLDHVVPLADLLSEANDGLRIERISSLQTPLEKTTKTLKYS